MTKLKYLLLLLALLFININSQTWHTYTNMKNAVAVSAVGDTIWTATTGGAFYYDIVNDTTQVVTQSDGLSSSTLTSTAVDNNGNIWFGTQDGNDEGMLNIYLPAEGTVREIGDIMNSNYSQKSINSLYSSGDTVFAATDFGVSLLDINNFNFYDTFVKFGDFEALSVVKKVYRAGKIYLVTANGLAVQRNFTANLSAPESWVSYPLGGNGIPTSEIYDVVKYQSQILVAANNGIYYQNGSTWDKYIDFSETVTDMAVYNNTLYFIAAGNSNNTIYSYNGSSLSTIYQVSSSTELNDLYVYNNSTIFAASSAGMLKLTDGNTETFIPKGPDANLFSDMIVDDDGTLWVATGSAGFGIGIMSFDGNTWQTYNMQNTPLFTSNNFYNVYLAPDKTIYFGNWGWAFADYKNGEFTNYYSTDLPITGITTNVNYIVIDDISVDSDGNIWLLNYWSNAGEPLSVMSTDGNITNFSVSSLIGSEDEMQNLVIDQYGTKWFGVTKESEGLYYFNENGTFDNTADDEMGRLTTNSGLINDKITALALDELGSIWVGTASGVTVINQPASPTTNMVTPTALRSQTVTCIAVDPLNRKWIGTVEGVIIMDEDGSEVIEQYTSANSPLPSNEITCITFNSSTGVAYIGTSTGMASVKTDAVKPVESLGEDLFIYPNPVVINGDEPKITIDGLVEDSQVKVISVSGKLIREFSTEGGRVATWNGRDNSGKLVASGIYIIVAYDTDGSNVSKGKVAIIRN